MKVQVWSRMRAVLGRHRRVAALAVGAALLAALVAWLVPTRLSRQLRGVVLVECRNYYAVPIAAGDTLFVCPSVRGGQVLSSLALRSDSLVPPAYASGFFASSGGLVVTAAAVARPEHDDLRREPARTVMQRRLLALDTLSRYLSAQLRELNYYARTHTPVDDGYQRVMEYGQRARLMQLRADTLRQALRRVLARPQVTALPRHRFGVVSVQPLDSGRVLSHRMDARLVASDDSALVLLQTVGGAMPRGAYAFATYALPAEHWPLAARHRTVLALPRYIMGPGQAATAMADALPLDGTPQPHYTLARGGAVVGAWGRLVGVVTPDGVASARRVARLLARHASAPRRWLDGLTLHAASELPPDTLRAPYEPLNLAGRRGTAGHYRVAADSVGPHYEGCWDRAGRQGDGLQRYAGGATYRGAWRNNRRQGYGVLTDSLGHRYVGWWQADTLARGCYEGADGFYEGHFNRNLVRTGHGVLTTHSGGHYDGQWLGGRRNGFGFSVEPHRIVRAGIWRNDNFRGEQMIYTPDRVYGIDISRYQHEVGRRRYSIDWRRLRITRMGRIGRRVQGTIDYPVSFVYIKATQGTSIRSRYYRSDAAAARRQGIAVGAYHFFSMKPGARQARHFLATARPQRGDLAPMLDVELTDRQIQKMGGRDAMFRQMLVWLRAVGRATGCRPVLYVSQRFVNRYLAHAPASLRAYKVWIARYGEYKPYVHLLYWQLSPYGRVSGIHGDVDINVFNGSRPYFEQMLREEGVK